jgi:hypothetical protein
MESLHQLQQEVTRDSGTKDLDVLGTKDSIYLEGDQLDKAGPTRVKTVQTKGLFHFMELPTEIRVKVCGLPSKSVRCFLIQTRRSKWE